jgi:hypothetical protein
MQARLWSILLLQRTTSFLFFLQCIVHVFLCTQAEVPQPQLPFGDINVLVLTDVHSWVAGHGRQEPRFDADYGDVLSFYQRLRRYTNQEGKDLFFVSNGDWVHGTGLNPVTEEGGADGSFLVPILQKMPWDAINCGNHELYDSNVVRLMTRPGGYIDWWGDSYLSGNVNYLTDDGLKPIGGKYKILEGFHSRVMVFGFLYNMMDACEIVTVDQVEDVIRQSWFKDALRKNEFDAIMILGHFDLKDDLVGYLLSAIRYLVGEDMPVQFITGHSHYRGYAKVDPHSTSFEAGKYLDTIGFVSLPKKDRFERRQLEGGSDNSTEPGDEDPPTIPLPPPTPAPVPARDRPEFFEYVFLDANKNVLKQVLGTDTLDTKDGSDLSLFIHKTREKMGLLDVIGCAPHSYVINTTIDDEESIWKLFKEEVFPNIFATHVYDTEDPRAVMLLPKSSWRYDLLATQRLIKDDIVSVAPFNDTIVKVGSIPGKFIKQVEKELNNPHDPYYDVLPNYIMVGSITDEETHHDLFSLDFHAPKIQNKLEEIMDEKLTPSQTQFTTLMIWEAYVMEYWPCSGIGFLPDWFPNIDTVRDADNLTRGLSIAVAVLTILFVCICAVCIARSCQYFCCSGPSYISPDEMDAFDLKMEDSGGDFRHEEGEYSNGLAGVYSPSYDDEDDHEML